VAQDKRSQIAALGEIETAEHAQPGDVARLVSARRPGGLVDERRRGIHALVENEVPIFIFPRRHAHGVVRHRQHFALVHEGVDGGIGGPNGFLRERIKLGRRGVEPHYRRRVVATQRVVD
jgi:hypothetical protein